MQETTDDGMKKRWLAAYVKMHHEKRVRDRLKALNIESFLPLQTEIRQWSDRKKKVDRILIPMMIFVKVNIREQLTVLQQPSVLRYLVLRGEHTPTEIPMSQMNRFKFMVDRSDKQVDFSSEDFQPGQRVRVIKGSLTGLEGELATVGGHSKIIVRIDQLGCAIVELNPDSIEKI